MGWKLIAAVVLLFVLCLAITYWAGGHFAELAAVEQCNTDRANDRTNYETGRVQAADAAREAQKRADTAALEETRRLLASAQAQAVEAQKSASQAEARASRLTSELERLKNENPDVNTWSDTCLPPALLRSLHPAENPPAGSPCR